MTEANGVLIRLAGSFAIERDGVPYPRGAIGGKARTLLKLLAAERSGVLAADRVAEALWPGGGPKQPVQNVATLVSRLRGTLGAGIVIGGRSGYRLGGAPGVRVDLDLAAGLVVEAEGCLNAGEASLAGAAAGRAVELLHDGVVLAGEPDAGWLAAAREEAAGLVRRARHAAAGAGLRGADPGRARRAAEAAVRADPFDEAACRLLMRAYAVAGEPAKALLAYERLRHRLAAELGTDPAAATRAVHVAILREEPVAAPGPALAGRGDEVARISRAWARAAAGRTGVLLIAGEPGIGKSRLAAEAERMAGATGGSVLRARCHEIERALFLQPFVDALRPRIAHLPGDVLRELAGTWAAALESLVQGQAMERRYAFEAVTAFLRALAAREPVLLVLEDLHAAGPATVELVHYLARRVSGVRLLIVATALTGEDGVVEALRGVAETVRPGPLPMAAVRELAGDAGLADEVWSRTRGQPQLVAALLAEAAAGMPAVRNGQMPEAVAGASAVGNGQVQEAVAGPSAVANGQVPEAVRVVVLGRLRGLGERGLRVLRAASVLGGAFDPVLLGGLLGLAPQEVAGHCERALGRGLLVVCGSAYEFANPLTREVLYTTTPAPTRLVYQREAQGQVLASASNTARSLSTGNTHMR
ncbi:AAA family ATPase [Nonomuraea sp. NPDC050404]|uniref:AAA family ATPase n=1 Tax=Nonomuraea sp. NPDC050404 TaxID=3155783 RepID=UPI0033DD0ADC